MTKYQKYVNIQSILKRNEKYCCIYWKNGSVDVRECRINIYSLLKEFRLHKNFSIIAYHVINRNTSTERVCYELLRVALTCISNGIHEEDPESNHVSALATKRDGLHLKPEEAIRKHRIKLCVLSRRTRGFE